jgi:hypothetical protein
MSSSWLAESRRIVTGENIVELGRIMTEDMRYGPNHPRQRLDERAKGKLYEIIFCKLRLRIKSCTGSRIRPIALV